MRKAVLILEPDRWLGEALVQCLAPAGDELRLTCVDALDAAARVVESARLDLVVVDLDAPSMDGYVLAARVLRLQPDVPVLVLTREGCPQLSQELADRQLRTLAKPLQLDRFREAVTASVRSTTRGRLTGVTAAGVLQLLSFEGRSGVLVLDLPDGAGRLVLEEGELVDAEACGARGEEAVFRIAKWLSRPDPEILLEDLTTPPERTIHRPLDGVLLEASRRRDEALRAVDELPSGRGE